MYSFLHYTRLNIRNENPVSCVGTGTRSRLFGLQFRRVIKRHPPKTSNFVILLGENQNFVILIRARIRNVKFDDDGDVLCEAGASRTLPSVYKVFGYSGPLAPLMLTSTSSHIQDLILRRKKSLAQEVRQKRDISDRRRVEGGETAAGSLCNLSVVILH